MPDDAIIRVKAEGFDEAERTANSFFELIQRLKGEGTASLSSSASSSLPSGAPSGATNPGDGLSGYGSSSPAGALQQAFGQLNAQVLASGGQFSGPAPAPATHPGDGLTSYSGSSAFPSVAPAGYNYDAGGRLRGPDGRFASAPAGSLPPPAPPTPPDDGLGGSGASNPLPNWNAFGDSGSPWDAAAGKWTGNILHSMGVPPELHSMVMSRLGGFMAPRAFGATMSPTAGVAAGAGITAAIAGVTDYGLASTNGAYQDWKAQYDYETQVLATRAAGDNYSVANQAQMGNIAAMRGRFAEHDVAANAFLQGIGGIPVIGGALRGYAQPFFNQALFDPQQRAVETQTARLADEQRVNLLESYGNVRDLATYDPYRGARTEIAGAVSAFGGAASDALMTGNFYGNARSMGITSGQMNQGISSAMSLALDPRNAAMYAQAARGGFADAGFLTNAAMQYAYNGDSMSLASMTPSLTGSGVSQSTIEDMKNFAVAMRAITNTITVAQAQITVSSSAAQAVGLTGGSYAQVGAALGGAISGSADIVTAAQSRLQAAKDTGNPTLIAQAQAELAQAQVSLDSARAGARQAVVTGLQTQAETASITAGAQFQRVTISGAGVGPTLGAFDVATSAAESQIRAKRQQVAQLRAYGNSDEADKLEASVHSDEVALAVRQTSGRADVGYQYGMAGVGLESAGVSAGMTQAALFGAPTQVYSAAMAQMGPLQEQYALTSAKLAAGGLSQPDIDTLKSKQIELIQQENVLRAEAARSLAQMNVSVAQASVTFAQAQVSIAAGTGLSSGQMGGLFAATTAGAGDVLSKAQAALSVLDQQGVSHGSQTYLDAQNAVASARQGVIQAGYQAVTAGPGSAIQLAQTEAGINATIATSTFTPWGNQRAAINQKMAADIAAGQQDRINYDRADSAAAEAGAKLGYAPGSPEMTALADSYKNAARQRQLGDVQNITADQQQLQTGWMDRLISSTYNAPGRAAYVDTQFTQREAAQFTQGISSVYGTTSTAARTGWMNYGDRLATSIIGNTGTPEGFLATAVNGGHGSAFDVAHGMSSHPVPSSNFVAPRAGVLAPGTGVGQQSVPAINLTIILKDSKTGAELARGKVVSDAVHANSNGAIALSGSQYTASLGSHQ